MMTTSSLVRLMLISAILFLVPNICTSAPHANKHHHENSLLARAALSTTPLPPSATPSGTVDLYSVFLSGSASPCSGTACATATPPGSPGRCPSENNTSHSLTVEADVYTVICDVDFVDQNIYPFVLATSFEACLTQCVQFNSRSTNELSRCVGFVYAPDRVHDADDCYLKSSLNSAISATISLIGATLGSGTSTTRSWKSTSSPAVQLSLAPTISASLAFAEVSTLQDAAAVRQTIKVPSVSNVKLHGPSKNTPTTQYIAHPPASPIKLASSVLVPGINSDLTNEYQIAGDTGTLTSSLVQASLADLSVVPHLSRDGGKGGEINGTHIFIFCDTAGFTTANASHNGDMVSFVSSSVAVDLGMDGLNGEALTLVDGIGEWQDDVGRLRGYAPMTTGEEAFNIALSGDGYRYALWPETSLIPLNSTHSIQYASLVYDEVNMTTQAAAFTSLGTSLLTVWVDPDYGPAAERTVNRLFSQDDVAWGSMGGIRAWGSTGVGGTDGKVYVFGKAARDEGLLLARTTPSNIADRSQYEYWTGSSWSPDMLPTTSTAYFINGSVMDIDVVYSPHHATFITIYLTCDADNTFYYRYLQSDHAISHPCPTNSSSFESDCVENIVKYAWSDPQVLYKASTPAMGYIYAGGIHIGYFGADDLSKGGTKMLLSWTQHTGMDAASPQSGYAHMTAAVTLE